MSSIKKSIWLAPLRGFTDTIFRTTYAAHFRGIEGAVAPFLTTTGDGQVKPSHVKELLPENDGSLTVVPQILSKSARGFLSLAGALADRGYTTINWNLGCPYPMVARKQRGSGLLPHPEMIGAFLDHVMGRISGSLSIKLRLGYHAADEIFALLPIFDQYPLKELIIHPRTGTQMYGGDPDETTFEKCLRSTSHQVMYNGDIRTAKDLARLQNKFTGVKRWMIGRGILADPCLPERIAGGDPQPLAAIHRFRRFHADLLHQYSLVLNGPGHLLGRMKGFWQYFSNNFGQGKGYLKKIQRSPTFSVFQRHIDALFESEEKYLQTYEGAANRPFKGDLDG